MNNSKIKTIEPNPFLIATSGRKNLLKEFFLTFFFNLSSYARIFLEVHIRRNFGYRYFKMVSALTIGIPLALEPLIMLPEYMNPHFDILAFLLHYGSWYGVLAIFFSACIKRQREIDYQPGIYDFAKVTDYSGDKNEFLRNLEIAGKPVSIKNFLTLVEPGIFFLIGLVFILFKQPIGFVFISSSFIYSLSYFGAIYLANESVMDIIDNIIRQEELANVIVKGRGPQDTRGFEFFGDFPEDMDLRQRIFDAVTSDNEVLQAY